MINYNLFRKIKIFFNLFLNSKITLGEPEKSDLVIYDCQSTEMIEKVLPNDKYLIVSTRLQRIKKLYVSRKIIIYIFFNFFKRSLKQNYLAALINIISLKILITQIDNSIDFYLTAKIFENKIKFIAVQNANRGDTVYSSADSIKKIFIPEFLCFSSFDEQLYKKKKCNIGKFEIVGSLRASLSKEYIDLNKKKINSEKFDICLLGEPHPHVGHSSDYPHVENFAEAVGKIAEYTHRLCKKNKLNLIFTGKRILNEDDGKLEILFYKKYLMNYDYKISQSTSRHEFFSYQNIMQSKLVIGHISTMLRETLAFDKKVLQCDFTGHPDVIFPGNELCTLQNTSFHTFEEKVLKILSMKKDEYFKKLGDKKNFIMETSKNTADVVRKKLKDYLI